MPSIERIEPKSEITHYNVRKTCQKSRQSLMRLEHWNTETDGTLTDAAFRDKLLALGYDVFRYVYPPGTYFPDHTHEVDKIDAILSGRFQMSIEGKTIILGAGDYLFVPKATVHSAEVIGNEPVVSLDAVKAR